MPKATRWHKLPVMSILLPLVIYGVMGEAVFAGEISVTDRRIDVNEEVLLLDLRLKGLFSERTLNAIQAGMTTRLAIKIRLSPRGRPAFEKDLVFQIHHDIWEGQFLVLKRASPPDTLRTTALDTVQQFCTEIDRVELIPIEHILPDEPFGLKLRIGIDTSTPEQARRTRKWLAPPQEDDEVDSPGGVRIDLGNVIDFFFNIYKPQEQSPWIDLGTYVGRVTDRMTLEELP